MNNYISFYIGIEFSNICLYQINKTYMVKKDVIFMELRVLRYFLTVVREENISKAAEILHMTQPTLSRQIAQMEEELGAQLFIRGRRLILTDAGMMLRHRAKEVVQLMEKIEDEFQAREDVAGTITIGCGGQTAVNYLLNSLTDFQKQYPKIHYDIHTNNADDIKERLEKGLLDFGVLLEPIDVGKYDYIRLKDKDRWGLFMNTNSELTPKTFITKDDLQNIPLITTNRQALQKEIHNWLGIDWEELNILGTYNIITNVAGIVANGDVYALTIEGAVKLYDPQKMVFRPLYPELLMTSVLAWKKFNPVFGAVEKFINYFKTVNENQIKL